MEYRVVSGVSIFYVNKKLFSSDQGTVAKWIPCRPHNLMVVDLSLAGCQHSNILIQDMNLVAAPTMGMSIRLAMCSTKG